MQRELKFLKRSEDEELKERGLAIDYDEMAKKGAVDAGEALISKWHGIYKSKLPGTFMARIVMPGGKITSAQARCIARAAEKYAQGKISITTRQTMQLHWLKLGSLADMLRDIAEEGLSTYHGCGDVPRNFAACPLAETCRYARFDVMPHTKRTAKFLTEADDLENLPRKFKVTFSGCEAGCAQPYMNCVGLMAVQKKSSNAVENGFRMVIGGGMGWKAFVAQEVFSFIPENQVQYAARAVALLFREHGDRFNRAKARLKFIVNRLGIDKCRELILDNLKKEGRSVDGYEWKPIEKTGPAFPARPLTEQNPVGTDGLHTVRIMVPKGELGYRQLLGIAEISEKYGNQRLYNTNRQNIEIHGVSPNDLSACIQEIEGLGFRTQGLFGLRDIVSCVGKTYCPKAVATTRELFDLIMPVVSKEKYDEIEYKAIINITGCPNSCSPYRISDIGFRGMRIREELGSVEGYEMLLGGSETAHGKKLGDFKRDDIPEIVETVLDFFAKQRSGDETLTDCVQRLGIDAFKQLIKGKYDYKKAAVPPEYSTEVGLAKERVDFESQAKNVPCQAGCPAATNVPGYIEKIFYGKYDEAYKINLEHNVFPGVLGRICARPCEDECRHLWTNVNGTVTICHLKRAAADRSRNSISSLPVWFDKTDKRVAVIGAGPCGLAAARELSRLGHSVCVYEKEDKPGGMMRDGIPAFRLPRDVLDDEINIALANGVELKTGVAIDSDKLKELARDYDAVLVATGTVLARKTEIKGIDADKLVYGIDFMKAFNNSSLSDIPNDVVIIGGGFTAVDCARAAVRKLREQGEHPRVSLVYRRTEQYMAASLTELEEMEAEGINIRTLLSPSYFDRDKGVVVFNKNKVTSKTDSNRKPAIEAVEGSFAEIKAGLVILAIGQVQDESVIPKELKDSPGIFTAGDFKTGALDVIHAVAEGKEAAYAMDEFLMGRRRVVKALNIEMTDCDGFTGRVRDHDLQKPVPMPALPLDERFYPDAEVETGYDDNGAYVNASRCYFCHFKFTIDQDKCIHCDWCIDAAPRKCIKRVSRFMLKDGIIRDYVEAGLSGDATFIWIDSDECIRCGKCLRVCPTGAISMRKTSYALCDCNGKRLDTLDN